MSQSGKLMPNLDQNSTKQLNLIVLQRVDPNIEEILMTAAHVTLYEFNIEGNQWSRKDVEGSLFVVKRNAQPRFQFIVMNRRNTENLVENLLGDFEFEVQVPYLLYRNASQEVSGIWFYNSCECEEVANLFSRIMNAFSKVPPKVRGPSSKSEFEELEAAANMTIMDEPLEPSSTVCATDAPDDPSFMNFFIASLNVGNNPPIVANSRPPNQPSATIPTVPYTAAVPSASPPYPDVSSYSIPSSFNSVAKSNSSDLISNKNLATNLVKPSSFIAAPSSTSLMMPPIPSATPAAVSLHQPPLSLQRPYGTPLLQPFPPPTPSPSLTPSPSPPAETPIISRDRVRDALLKLAQDGQFIDMFHKALLKVHQS